MPNLLSLSPQQQEQNPCTVQIQRETPRPTAETPARLLAALPAQRPRALPHPPLVKVKSAHQLWAAWRSRKCSRPLVAALPGKHFRRTLKTSARAPAPKPTPPGPGQRKAGKRRGSSLLVSPARTLPGTRDAEAAARSDVRSGLSPQVSWRASRSSAPPPGPPHLKVNASRVAAFTPAGPFQNKLPEPFSLSSCHLFISGPLPALTVLTGTANV